MGYLDQLKQISQEQKEERAQRKAEYEEKNSSLAYIDRDSKTFVATNAEASGLANALVEKMNDALKSMNEAGVQLSYTTKSGETKPAKAVIKAEIAKDLKDGSTMYFPKRDETGNVMRDENNRFIPDTSHPVIQTTANINLNITKPDPENSEQHLAVPNRSLLVTLNAKSSLDEEGKITITSARAAEFENQQCVKQSKNISEIIENYSDTDIAAAMKKMLRDNVIEPDYSHALENMQFRINEQLKEAEGNIIMLGEVVRDANNDIVMDNNGRAVRDETKLKATQDYYCQFNEREGNGDSVFKSLEIKSHSAPDVRFQLTLSEETGKHFAKLVDWGQKDEAGKPFEIDVNNDTVDILAVAMQEKTPPVDLNLDVIDVVAKYANVEFHKDMAKDLVDAEKQSKTPNKVKDAPSKEMA